MSVILQPEELTRGERLLINRRRKGQTWYQAAEARNIPGKRYRLQEADKVPNAPFVPANHLTKLEKCFLQRRRWKITQKALGEDLNLSRAWVNQMENGSADPARLIYYWQSLNGEKPAISNV